MSRQRSIILPPTADPHLRQLDNRNKLNILEQAQNEWKRILQHQPHHHHPTTTKGGGIQVELHPPPPPSPIADAIGMKQEEDRVEEEGTGG